MKKPRLLILCLLALVSISLFAEKPALFIPETTTSGRYRFSFDDILLGDHKHDNANVDDQRIYSFTMSVRVKPVTLSMITGNTNNYPEIFGYGQGANYNNNGCFAVALNAGKLGIFNRARKAPSGFTPQGNRFSEVTLSADEWAFVTLVVDDENKLLKLYKDAVEAASWPISEAGIGMLPDSCVFFAGNKYFSGYFSEYQVWNKVLTTEEITASMAGYTNDIPEDLIYYYDFVTKEDDHTFANKGANPVPAALYKGAGSNFGDMKFANPVIIEPTTVSSYTVTYNGAAQNGSFVVKNGNEEVASGSTLMQGTVLTVEVTPDEGYDLKSIMVNSIAIEGNTFTLSENVTVTVSFNEPSGSAIRVPGTQGTDKYQFRFDDKLLGAHKNGTATGDERIRSFTMSVWVKTITTKNGKIFGHVQEEFWGANGTFAVILDANGKLGVRSRSWNTGTSCPEDKPEGISNETLSADEWAFLTLTIDNPNKKIKLYKDGTEILDRDMKNNGIGLLADSCIFFCGNGWDSGAAGYQGDFDEVQLWNKVLTEEEIIASMDGYQTAPEGLIYYYNFLDMTPDFTFSNKGTGGECNAALCRNTATGINGYTNPTPVAPQFVLGHVLEKCTITYESTVTGGSVVIKNGNNEVASGSELNIGTLLTVETTPTAGYQVRTIKVNDTAIQGNTFRLTGNSVVTVEFTNKLIVTYTVGEGGSMVVKENGTTELENNAEFSNGSSLEITITPDTGYDIAGLVVNEDDKTSEITGGKYTATNCTENTNITATFVKKKYAVNFTAGANGSILVKRGSLTVTNGEQLEFGTQLTISVTPVTDATIETFTINGVDKKPELISNTIVVKLTEALDIKATFRTEEFALTYNTPENGTVKVTYDGLELASGDPIQKNTYLEVELTPNANYSIESLIVNGQNVTSGIYEGKYWVQVTGNVNIVVAFKSDLAEYTVTFNAPENGSLTVKKTGVEITSGTAVTEGTELVIGLSPANRYIIDFLKVNEVDVTSQINQSTNEYTFTVEANVTIEGAFKQGVGVDDILLSNVQVYYNNTEGMLYVSGLAEERTVSVYNMLGTTIVLQSTADVFDISSLSNGIYIVKIMGGTAERSVKFIKK